MARKTSEYQPQTSPVGRPQGGWRTDGSWGDEVDSRSPLTNLVYDTRREIRSGNLSPADTVRRFQAMGFDRVFRDPGQWLDIESFYGWPLAQAATHVEGSLKLMHLHAPVTSDGVRPGTAADVDELSSRVLHSCGEHKADRKTEYDSLLTAGTVVGRGGSVDEAVRIIESNLGQVLPEATGGATVPQSWYETSED
jgi:hypothetical protein